MVAVRQKVGARGFMKSKPLNKGKKVFKIDCTVPATDGIFDETLLGAFEQYFQQNVKLHGRKGKLSDKVKVNMDKNILSVSTTMAYKKRYFKYLTKKFLKKKELRDWLRILATGKTGYSLKYYNIRGDEDEEAEAEE
jgi:large subunit ribosomal protein L22e